MTRFAIVLAGLATVVIPVQACGGSSSNSSASVAGNTRADAAHVAVQATEPRTGDVTAAAPARPAPTSAAATLGVSGSTSSPASTAPAATANADEPAAPPPSHISARHVLIQWMGSDRAGKSVLRTQEQALALAQEVLKRAKAGDDIARLAVEYSDEPNAGARGGSLGRFSKGQMVGQFETVAFKLKVGEISSIVETKFGYHIIQRTE